MGELDFLEALGAWGSFLLVLIALALRLFWGVDRDEGRGRWVSWLQHDTFALRYRRLLDVGLNRLDRGLSPDFRAGRTHARRNSKTEPARAWSVGLLNLCLTLAVAYPLLAVLLDWAVTGDAGRIGGVEVIPAQPEWRGRWLPVALSSLSFAFAGLAWRFASADAVTFAATAIAASAAAAATAAAVAAAGAFAAAGAGAAAFATAGAGVAALAAATAAAVAGAFVVLGALTIAVAFVGAVAAGVAGTGAGALATAFAAAGAGGAAVAGAFAQDWLGRRFDLRRLSLLAFSSLVFTGVWMTISRAGSGLDDERRGIVLFLDFLPLLNAWADFASVGLTRWRLRWGVQGHLVFNAVLDALAALLILLLLAFAIIATIHFVRPGGAALADLTDLLADLEGHNRGQYFWLGFMLFSTLLPTLIHLCIGALALFTLFSGWLGRPVAAGLMKGNSPEGRAAVLALTISSALAIWVPCFLLWHTLTLGGGWVLDALISACAWFHGLLVAWFPVQPGA